MDRRSVLRLTVGGLGLHAVGSVAGATGYEPLGSMTVPGAKEAVVGADGVTVYVATTTGYAIIDVSDPRRPQLLHQDRNLLADLEGGPLHGIQDVSVAGERLLVVGPADGGQGEFRAAIIYDVSDPAAPVLLDHHETGFPIHNATLAGDRAYLTGNDGETNSLVIVDLNGRPRVVGRWSPLDHSLAWRSVHPDLRVLHDLSVHDGLAFCNYWDAGTWIVDVRNPREPSFVGRAGGRSRAELAAVPSEDLSREKTELPGNDHSCALDESGRLLAIGQEAWNVGVDGPGPGGIHLWEVSNPSRPRHLSSIEPPPTLDATLGGVWTTAHNFDLNGGRLYSAWYQGGVKMHDISNPAKPIERAWWRDPAASRFWTAQRAATGIVAASMGTLSTPQRLYMFPKMAGTQANPPRLTPPANQSTTPTANPDPAFRRERTSPPITVEQSPTDVATPTSTPTESATSTPGQSGFGAATGLMGLLVALGWYRSRQRRE